MRLVRRRPELGALLLSAALSSCEDARQARPLPQVEAGAAGESPSPSPGGAAGDGADAVGGDAGCGGASAPPALLRDDRAITARGVGVALNPLDNDERVEAVTIEIVVKPAHGSLVMQPEGLVHYRPSEGYSGLDRFTYTVEGASASAQVSVEVLDEEWLLVGGAPYEVWQGPSPDLHQSPSAERWTFFDATAREVFGFVETAAGPRAFTLERGASTPRFLAPAPSRAHHVGSGVLSGVVNGHGAFWFEGEWTLDVPAWASGTELFGRNASGVVLARGSIDGSVGPLLHRPDGGLEAVTGLPEGALFGLNDEGVLVGSLKSNGVDTAVRVDAAGPKILALPPASRSVAYDLDNDGAVVGSLQAVGQYERGFLLPPSAPAELVHLRGAVSTQLFGIGPQGELVGSVLSPLGYYSGFVASPRSKALSPGTELLAPADAANPGVSHACIHATEGPFRVLNATSGDDATRAFDEPHTMYTLRLAPGAESHFRYAAPSPEQVSFFVYPPAALRVYDEEGGHVVPTLVRPSTLCPRIHFVYQYAVRSAGVHAVVVDPHPSDAVSVIFERSWAYEG